MKMNDKTYDPNKPVAIEWDTMNARWFLKNKINYGEVVSNKLWSPAGTEGFVDLVYEATARGARITHEQMWHLIGLINNHHPTIEEVESDEDFFKWNMDATMIALWINSCGER
jgi:hypothetical protein